MAERLPASAAADYGTPFYDIFKRYDGQFYKIDKMLFSPAEVTINNLLTGRRRPSGTGECGGAARLAGARVKVAILGSRGGWHESRLVEALEAREVEPVVVPITRLVRARRRARGDRRRSPTT